MAKKNFDTFLNTVKAPKMSAEEIEEMTREVHHKIEKVVPVAPIVEAIAAPVLPPPPAPVVQNTPKVTPKPPAPRGRRPKPVELERTIRVSVDLPESTIISLKTKVTREQTDMKTYIRFLVERELRKEFG
jgi:hypothetical protein